MVYNIEALLPSILDAEQWIGQFTAKKYPSAFAAYKEQYREVYTQALVELTPEHLAEELLNAEAQSRGRQKSTLSIRMMLGFYVTPMLLDVGGAAQELATALCCRWAQTHPREAYTVSSFDEICQGFRKKILSIDFGCVYN